MPQKTSSKKNQAIFSKLAHRSRKALNVAFLNRKRTMWRSGSWYTLSILWTSTGNCQVLLDAYAEQSACIGQPHQLELRVGVV